MNNIKEYTDFLNEDEGFWSKSFEDRIDEIDDLLIQAADYNGKSEWSEHDNDWSRREYRKKNLQNYLRTLAEITEILDNILKKYGRNLSQEQLNVITKRYKVIKIGGTGYNIESYKYLYEIRDNANSILCILQHLKEFYDMKIDLDEKVFNNPFMFYKKGDYYYIVHKSYVDREKKKLKDAHAGVDPFGEENWDA